jgi:uncharacterized protein (DUF4415 family)
MTTKKASRKPAVENVDLRQEYAFDYSKAKPNRFAAKLSRETVAVVLDSDVAEVFRTSESVNALLRSVIAALPEAPARSRGNR